MENVAVVGDHLVVFLSLGNQVLFLHQKNVLENKLKCCSVSKLVKTFPKKFFLRC